MSRKYSIAVPFGKGGELMTRTPQAVLKTGAVAAARRGLS